MAVYVAAVAARRGLGNHTRYTAAAARGELFLSEKREVCIRKARLFQIERGGRAKTY
jgi:hypothetical protein